MRKSQTTPQSWSQKGVTCFSSHLGKSYRTCTARNQPSLGSRPIPRINLPTRKKWFGEQVGFLWLPHTLATASLVPRPCGRRETAWSKLLVHVQSSPENLESIYVGKFSVKPICIRPIYFRIIKRCSRLPVELPSAP